MTPRRLAPFVVFAALLASIAVVAPEIYSGTFSDLGTFFRAAGLALALTVWVIAIRRLVSHEATATVVAAVPVLVVVSLVLWPYVRPATEVNEAFPPITASTTTPPTTAPTTTTIPPTITIGSTEPTTTTTTLPPEPLELARSEFQGLTGHRGSGDAAVYRLAGESILLRFEEVDIGSGPDLEVYLVPGNDQRGLGGGHHVAALTAERGNQNYTVPAGVDLTSGMWTVLVWCETFDVEVANATLTL